MNAIDDTMLSELHSAFEKLGRSDAIKAVVLAGHGRAFSAGFDLGWLVDLEAKTIEEGMDGTSALFEVVQSCAQPLIAAVHGAAMGAGLLLALAADIRLASEAASFAAPEVKIGLFPALALVPRLERTVGLSAAKRLLLTGDSISGREAERIGLVDSILPADGLHAETQAFAERLASLPPTAVQLTKAAFAAVRRPGYAEWENEQFATCWRLPEREAAMRAFLGK
jgi:enoyl-CoA hydratase/carnithine racemase